MQCPNCHSQMPEGARFCTNCGAQIPEQPAPTSNSTEVFGQTPATPQAPQTPAAPQAPQAPQAPMGGMPGGMPAMQPVVRTRVPVWAFIVIGILAASTAAFAVLYFLGGKKTSDIIEPWPEPTPDPVVIVDPTPTNNCPPTTSGLGPVFFNSNNRYQLNVTGECGGWEPRIKVTFTKNSNGTVSATGTATYGSAVYDLRASDGEYDSSCQIVIELREYNSSGTWTGTWNGTVCTDDGRPNFYGHFYNTDGSDHGFFDFY